MSWDMVHTEWILCPVCGSKTRSRIREDTILINYPLYCPKCKQEVFKAADTLYQRYIMEGMGSGKYPPYKAIGIAYIQFAREEKELFKLLFMHDRTQGNTEKINEAVKPFVEILHQKIGLNEEDAYLFRLEMWMYVHGIATTIATSYLEWDREYISRMLTDGYEGIKSRYVEGKSE